MKRIIFLFIMMSALAINLSAQKDSLFFISKEDTRVAVNADYSYQPKAFDSANNSISYSINDLASWLRWNAGTQSISGKTNKAGQYPINIIAYSETDTVHQRYM